MRRRSTTGSSSRPGSRRLLRREWVPPAMPAARHIPQGVPPTALRVKPGAVPSFDWNAVRGARRYDLEVSTDPHFGTSVLDKVTTVAHVLHGDEGVPVRQADLLARPRGRRDVDRPHVGRGRAVPDRAPRSRAPAQRGQRKRRHPDLALGPGAGCGWLRHPRRIAERNTARLQQPASAGVRADADDGDRGLPLARPRDFASGFGNRSRPLLTRD